MKISPRPYQKEAIEAILAAKEQGISRQLVSLPTGAGKTIVFSLLARRLQTKTLILAHREELLEQAWQKMRMVYPEASLGLVRGTRNDYAADVVISSVQTASQPKRLALLRRAGFETLVIDEAHHASAKSYRSVIAGLGFFSGDPKRLLVGVTATAFRGDGKGLGDVFQKVVYERTIMAMIRGGYLCDAVGVRVETQVDLSGVRTSGGDFQVNELAFKINVPERNRLVANTYVSECGNRKAVVFCADVQHAKDMAETFISQGIPAAAIWGNMGKDDRRRTLKAFSDGRYQVLTNCAVLTEGFDDPGIGSVILARPTKSKSLYVQMVGRGLRTYPGKDSCLVVDFGDNAGRHKLCGLATLVGEEKVGKIRQGESLSQAVARQEESPEGEVNITAHSSEIVDLFERSKFVWSQVKDHFRLSLGGANRVWLKHTGPDQYEVIVYAGQMPVETLSSEPIPLGYAQGVAEDYVRLKGDNYVPTKKDLERRASIPATEKQKRLMEKWRIPFDQNTSSADASRLIDEKAVKREAAALEPATAAQIKHMRWKHIPYPEGCTKAQATQLIARSVRKEVAC